MSGELPLNLQGGVNPCYIFYIRLIDCVKRESFVSLYCKDQHEDYRECKFGKRHVRISLIIYLEKFQSMVC